MVCCAVDLCSCVVVCGAVLSCVVLCVDALCAEKLLYFSFNVLFPPVLGGGQWLHCRTFDGAVSYMYFISGCPS